MIGVIKVNLPNKLTVIRRILVPVFMAFMYIDSPYSFLIALIIFCVASFTDFLDGHIARKNNLVTDFGKFMDPLADKLLTTVAIIYLCKLNFCSEIVLCIVLAREFAVSGIRMIAAANPAGSRVIAAGIMGKAKTVFQMVSIILALADLALFDLGVLSRGTFDIIHTVVNVLMWIMAVLTVFIRKTKLGRAMIAVSEDRGAAELMGINVNLIITLTFAIGSALAAFASAFYVMQIPSVSPTLGSLPGIKAFTAAVIGGIGSIPGAMIGGVLLGVIEKVCLSVPVLNPYTTAIEFSLLILILLVKPTGLLGRKRREKV